MVINKRAQGLPLHFIVIAAIAALVLVLVIAFTIGGFGSFFGKIFGAGKATVGDEIDVVKTTCGGLCDTAKSSVTTSAWTASQYCSRTFNMDLDKDGGLGCPTDAEANDCLDADSEKDQNRNKAGGLELGIHCDKEPISISCSTTIEGTSMSENDCSHNQL